MFWDLVLVFFAASGFVLLLWCLIGAMLHPVFSMRSVTFLPVDGDAESLEQQSRAFAWLRDGKNAGGKLVLVDCGLSEKGLQCVKLLCEQYPWLVVCDTTEVENYIYP
jgi:hypothetical protein